MLEHGPEGALGVVINRPSRLPVAGTIDEWVEFTATPTTVFIGGPVSPSSVIALAAVDNSDFDGESSWSPIIGRLGTVDLEAKPADVEGLKTVRMFAGYAGWEAGQLEAELVLDSWYVVDVGSGDLHDPNPEELWWTILGRQPGELGRLRNYPADPWVN